MINHSNENVLMDDANSPDVNRKLLGMVSTDFVKVADQLKEASYQIRKRGFSDHPIFAVTREAAEIGILLFAPEDLTNRWMYRASFLQEFVDRRLIGPESVELFKENYKNPDEFCCLFVIHGDFAGFVFMPFPED
ncbi:hypothetical protein GCM10027275_44310 [Rhabdobacter roseus]|uniref:Phage pi2 protein 07 n=1 Tax=Rhabdobacter roseus TaxID=1655419 RepID=A0A840TY28_9BACT|nr:hypothetical protein [Rhabdobacter roseus]MBB5286512.1 phage pi2 protein 07 [Rhabdobacter roseus]